MRALARSPTANAVLAYLPLLAGIGAAGLLGFGRGDTGETGPLELLQLGALVLALVLWAALGAKATREDPRGLEADAWAVVGLFLALLTFLFLGRETSWLRIWDVQSIAGAPIKAIGTAVIVAGLVAVAWLAYRLDRKTEAMIAVLRSPAFAFVVLAGAWILLGDAFEKNLFEQDDAQYYEELFELAGYLTLLYAAGTVHASRRAPHGRAGRAGERSGPQALP